MIDFAQKPTFLAPLAGYTDLPFRGVAKRFGVDVTVSEMISSHSLVHNPLKISKMIEKAPSETPYIVQLSANNPAILKSAVEVLNTFDGIDGIDLNSGCPAPKIVSHGSGSALLKDISLLSSMIETIKNTSTKRYTSVKVRIGFNDKYASDIAKACEAGGADWMVVHGRTRSGGYTSVVDYDEIRSAKESVKIPVIANGDITDYAKAGEVLEYTRADGVMIGRGAIGKPWIFYQLKNNQQVITNRLKIEVVSEHLTQMVNFYGDTGVVLFRKHLHNYSKGLARAGEFRELINHENDYRVVLELIKEYFGD